MLQRLCALTTAVLVLLAVLASPGGAGEIELNSEAAVLMDAVSGEVLTAKNPHQSLPPASVTKLMTMLLVFEALDRGTVKLEDEVRCSASAAGLGGSQIWLEPGEIMPLEELIRAVAVRSANDAAAAIAEHVAGTEEEFVRLMNERARQLGMKNSRFVNSHGLYHSEHYMSAYDTALLSRHIVLHEPEILDYTGRWEDHIRVGTEDEQWLVNTNKLIKRYQGVDGLKTGWSGSESGWCVSATARRGETRFVAVIMKGPSAKVRFEEAAKLLNYGFANFESVLVASANSVLGTIPVDEGNVNEVKAVLPDTFGVTVKKGQAKKLERTVALADYITAPVKEGDRVGEVVVELEGEKVAQAELVADASVERISWLGLFVRNLRRAWPIQVD